MMHVTCGGWHTLGLLVGGWAGGVVALTVVVVMVAKAGVMAMVVRFDSG
jgi:hypothetical protein